ncbi:MAG: LapA family protein [Opitutae bacterium]|nr:LapA family protein [Opitutae bacterium]
MNIKLLLVVFLMLLVALFSVQNAGMITVRFLYWQFSMSQALVILLAAICGALGGVITGAVAARRKRAFAPEAQTTNKS